MAQGKHRLIYDVPPLPPVVGAVLFSVIVLLAVAILATALL